MSEDELTLSWSGVFGYARHAIHRSWIVLLSGTLSIAILAILIPWGFVYGFSESGWDQVMGGNACGLYSPFRRGFLSWGFGIWSVPRWAMPRQ
jgi:hypothetical protein